MSFSLMRLTLSVLMCTTLSFAADAPLSLHPPAGQQLLFAAHAKGDQIYTCKSVDDHYAWTLKAPDAKLINEQGTLIATHYAGPTWQSSDHSTVTGKMAASVPASDPKSIPWLLVSAIDHSRSGVMSGVLSIQRVNTQGGVAPATGCDASHVGAETRASYTADYHFYGKPN